MISIRVSYGSFSKFGVPFGGSFLYKGAVLCWGAEKGPTLENYPYGMKLY